MSKMIDLGHIESTSDMTVAQKRRSPRKEYPSVWVHHTKLPLSPTDVGKTITVEATIHVTGIEEETSERRGKSKESCPRPGHAGDERSPVEYKLSKKTPGKGRRGL
ncbi:MAG: hypothetical protein ACYTBS_28185 [Planctomycetota bacterium]|jgi:hypothetical protein